MTTYEKVREILGELDDVFSRVDDKEINALCDAVLSARRIAFFGLGRSMDQQSSRRARR
jgi:DNA-binding MurR/RpiR family transcriptional regulator